MPLVRLRKPAIKRPVLGLKAPTPSSALVPTPAASIPQVKRFNKFMQTFIIRVQAPIALAKVKDDANKTLKHRNLDLYYYNLHIECYYPGQQYKVYFEVTNSLGPKHVPFVGGLRKDHILNR